MKPDPSPPDGDAGPLRPRQLTWAALLARWVEFAKSAVALPDDPQGRLLRQSVPDIIMLQAVWYALGELESLPAEERALGLDRAQVLVDKHAQAIVARWSPDPPPAQVQDIIEDALARLRSLV